jgi:hypothetical protein
VIRAIVRSFAVAALLAALALGGECLHFALCPEHRAVGREVILDDGFAVARPGDGLFACTVRHCLVGGWCHDDERCICAPSDLHNGEVAQRVGGGNCRLDHLRPSRDDASGACRRARCNDHIDR